MNISRARIQKIRSENKLQGKNPYQPPCSDDFPQLQPTPRDRCALRLVGVHALIVLQKKLLVSDDLFNLTDNLTKEAGFIEFLAALAADYTDGCAKEAVQPCSLYRSGANGWENGTIEAF